MNCDSADPINSRENVTQMMDEHHSSGDYIAPLHVVKTRSPAPKVPLLNTSGHTLNQQRLSSTSRAPPSPPQTPQEREHSKAASPEESFFPNFLRATHQFQPASADAFAADTSITVPINPGEIILVHSVHSNGWADGTLLLSGARGWLPTNYCETLTDASLEHILSSLTYLWDLVQGVTCGDFTAFGQEDYVRRMIAGVRHFLVCTNVEMR